MLTLVASDAGRRFSRSIRPLVCTGVGLAMVLMLGVVLPAANGQDWPQFRGPAGNATSATQPPAKWSDQEHVHWKVKLPGKGASSPIVVRDRIFLTAYSGYGDSVQNPGDKSQLKLHTLCLDRATGKLLWDRSISASSQEQDLSRRVADHGYASGTPATDGEAVYSYFGVSGLVAYDLEGKQLWHRGDLGSKTAGFGSASSPVVDDDHVYVNASIEGQTLYALDKKTGKEVWSRPGITRSWSTPCLAESAQGKTELIINQKSVVYGLDPASGEELWSCKGIEDYVVPVPISHEGIIYCLGGRSNRAMAIRLGGRGDVTETHRLWMVNVGANVTSPVYFEGHLYWASDKGIANCLEAETGKTVFRERMPTSARVYASIVRGGKHLYLTTRDSGVWVLAAQPEFEPLALNRLESETGMFNASPAIVDGRLLLRTDDYLYCIGNPSP